MTTDSNTDFFERLINHPKLRRRFESILDVAEAKGEGPDTADAVEARVIKEVQQLGSEVISDWGQDKADREAKEQRAADPKVHSYKKKRLHGTQPSVQLK